MTNKSLKGLQKDCKDLLLPISGTKPELRERIRQAKSGQTSIMFTPSKRKRPDPNIEGEDEMEDKIGTPRKKMKEGGKKPSSPGARTEGRGDLTPAASNSVEHRPEKTRGFMPKEDKEPQKNT